MAIEYRDLSKFQYSDQYSSRVIQKNPHRIPYKGGLVPESLTFGSVIAGKQGRAMNVTLINEGFRDLPIRDIKVTSDFVMTTDCPVGGVLGEGKTCNIVVNFAPTSTGSKQGGIYVDTGDARGDEFVSLSGYGVANNVGSLATSVDKLDFSYVAVGGSATQSVSITNNGSQPLVISQISATGDFKVKNGPTMPATLAANSSVSMDVVFTPSTAEDKSGTLTFQHNGIGQYSILLSGSGKVVAP